MHRYKTTVENNDYVDDVVYSIAEAYLYKDESECFGIFKDGQVIGFISIYYGEDNYQIINFVIDEAYRCRVGFKMSDTVEDDYVFMRIYYE